MRNYWKQLNEPFPDRKSLGKSILSLLGVGLFVSLFLFLLRPFGMQFMSQGWLLLFISLGFGLVTVLFGLLFDLVLIYVLKIRTDLPSWTLWKWIVQSLALLVWIALGNFLYMSMLMPEAPEWVFLFDMFLNTVIVGIFPIVFSGLRIQLKAIKTNQQQAENIQPTLSPLDVPDKAPLVLTPASGKQLELQLAQIRYIEAMQNYVSVTFVEAGELKKEMLRSTIANMEAQVNESAIIRCHRSYLVNLDSVNNVSGNAQGLKLRLTEVSDLEIPVSRSFIPRVRELLAQP